MAEGEEVEVAEEDVGVGVELEVDGDVKLKLIKKILHYCIASHLFGSSSKDIYILLYCIVSYHNIVR